MAQIYAPNKEYTGVSAGVSFCNGVGETEDPHIIEWFITHGYRVEDMDPEQASVPAPKKKPARKAGE